MHFTPKGTYPLALQKSFDKDEKTVFILGSGWAATSMLKNTDREEYNVPRNYFLFTPLLPSVAVGALEPRSVIQSTRYVARHKARRVSIYEAEALKVFPHNKQVTIADLSNIKGDVNNMTILDILVYAVGGETQTFGIPGVKEARSVDRRGSKKGFEHGLMIVVTSFSSSFDCGHISTPAS
ncbi:hypothetical protein M407DRAFT_21919 [Tulasnella calospora MUT 4182]|uniref:NADH:ubiquinone reductase (non-electrogenic) n=1 Tax=Tulasnella calospora MUT 4182 TaxID=1051891 RepID=A0A0C3M5T5_9AGAM|nr:hypothetical protein M407DRAFT_21919 [Tulasnella calospora MUT 4182]